MNTQETKETDVLFNNTNILWEGIGPMRGGEGR